MPAPSRWLIRSAYTCLLVGMIVGAVMLVHKAYPLHPAIWSLLPVHIELLVVGWIVQFTMGTAYWILPRYLKDSSRGNARLARLMFLLLNIGIVVVIADRLIVSTLPLAIMGRLCEVAAVVLFISLHWQRIVTYNN
ncbi:cbb3-type cytochrome c oxidase subunit I [Fodinibius sediminis]|uniref:cbb3-type cytochrome c oxidase subunit I n=1 Tax=Fodinibius sediminis TaxID=1214077 RepID=UPI001157AD94|nr:cbb3-type cytochrome c oxidase subunit I [Fodinibius sediminis]